MDLAKNQGGISTVTKALEHQVLGAQVISKTLQYLEQTSKDDSLKAALDLQKTVLNGATNGKTVSSLIDILA
jgi:hypothetical protein